MSRRSGETATARIGVAALAAVCYLPLLATHRGMVGADTKSYLYLDPGRLLAGAWSMWDPNVGMGTVTHQNIGYLWPMGPWFASFEALGAPDWIAQRLWLGSILFLAGLGVRYLLRTLGQRGAPVTAAMFVYALTPYVLTLGARISALLLPYAALGWMIGLVIRAGRTRSWLHPALFALLVPTAGSTNATALVLVGVAPLAWLVHATVISRELTVRNALTTIGKIGLLTVGTSLWWIAGLWAQGAYGIDVLRYTETAKTVAADSTAPELLRGLGYWFFYGDDKLGPWTEASTPYTQNPLVIGLSFLIPVLALVGAGAVRWRHRGFFVALVAIGLVLGVGAFPWDDPPLWGDVVKAFVSSDVGLAMRSLPRAVPLIALGLAVLAGMGIAALGRLATAWTRPLAYGLAALSVLALPPLWTGNMVGRNLERDETLPDYVTEAAAAMDARDQGQGDDASRVLIVPGSDFASYRYGNTVDPVLPGIMERPVVARELIPYGTAPSADLLNALDGQMQSYTLEPEALAPVARLMGAGDVLLRGDLAYERYNLARPRLLYDLLREAPDVDEVAGFGGDDANVPTPELPLVDELELGAPPDLPDPSKLTLFDVENPEALVRLKAARSPVILAGDAEGIIAAAATGVIDGSEPVLYSASFADRPERLAELAQRPGARLVLTDTNRRAARRWSTVVETNGATERAGQEPLADDPSDNRLPLFPDAGDDARTVALQQGGVTADATSYGNRVTYTPEDRAANAVDDDRRSAWTTGTFSPVQGDRLQLTYDEARTTDEITFQQSDSGVQNRWITRVALTFDDDETVEVDLGEASHQAPGQTVDIGRRTFSKLSIEVIDDTAGTRDRYDGLSGVGFADVALGQGDVRLDEVIRLPVQPVDELGSTAGDRPLSIVLTRRRTRPSAALRGDEEPTMDRAFRTDADRSFTLTGEARLSARASEAVINPIVGIPPADAGGVDASASRTLAGDITARAVNAIDRDPRTAFQPGFLDQTGESLHYRVDDAITIDELNLDLITDGRHSVPTRLRVDAGSNSTTVEVPPLADKAAKDATSKVSVPLPEPVRGSDITVTVEAVREVRTVDWVSELPVVMPVGIAELGIDGLSVEPAGGAIDDRCRRDLVTIDGRPVGIRLSGAIEAATRGDALDVELCAPSGISLDAGEHVLRTADGRDLGISVDQLRLDGAPSGPAPAPAPGTGADPAADGGPEPAGDIGQTGAGEDDLRVSDIGRTEATVEVAASDQDRWLVLGESHSEGWTATVDGQDLGEPDVIDGYANGWQLPAGPARTVALTWAPQRVINGALAASVVAALVCLAVVALALARRRRARSDDARGPDVGAESPAPLRLAGLASSPGTAPSIRATVLVLIGAGLVTGAVIGPAVGLAAAAGAAAVLRVRRARALTTLGPAVLLAGCGLYVVAHQILARTPQGFEWPAATAELHRFAYFAIALLVLDIITDRLWTGRWWPRSGTQAATGRG